MERAKMPAYAMILPMCVFISITALSVYINTTPDIVVECAMCGETAPGGYCCSQATEDFNLWGCMYSYKIAPHTIIGGFIIFLLTTYSLAVMTERWWKYLVAERQSREFKTKLNDAIDMKCVQRAIHLAPSYEQSPLALVVIASFQEDGFRPSLSARHREIANVTEELKRGLWSLAAAGWTIPLTGFFVFIAGLIQMLQVMKYAEGAGISFVAGSFANSLWATVLSIFACIPIIWSHRFFTSKVESFTMEMDRLSLAVISEVAGQKQLSDATAHSVTGRVRAMDTSPLAD